MYAMKNKAIQNSHSDTALMLFFQFRSELVHLDEISETWLGMKPKYAREKFNRGELPIPAFRLCDSQCSPIVCSIKDLAEHIEKRAAKARYNFERAKI